MVIRYGKKDLKITRGPLLLLFRCTSTVTTQGMTKGKDIVGSQDKTTRSERVENSNCKHRIVLMCNEVLYLDTPTNSSLNLDSYGLTADLYLKTSHEKSYPRLEVRRLNFV